MSIGRGVKKAEKSSDRDQINGHNRRGGSNGTQNNFDLRN